MDSKEEKGLFEKLAEGGAVMPTVGMKNAIHIGESDLPFVPLGDGSSIQLLHVDLTQGLWVVRARFCPGYQVDTHYHTGVVFAVTFSGSWHYAEHPADVNTAGSYLFEPAHSVHTLTVSKDNTQDTDVWFAIYGANININPQNGQIESVLDAQAILTIYRDLCAAQGSNCDKLLVVGE